MSILYENNRKFIDDNANIIAGWRLCVTMQPRTPLAWLLRHGEFHPGPKPPQEAVPPEHGIWGPQTKTFRELGIDLDELPPSTVASQWGQIPKDGGECLAFLIAYRQIVESEMTAEEQAAHVQELCNRYPQFPLPPLTPRTARRPGGGPGAPSLNQCGSADP